MTYDSPFWAIEVKVIPGTANFKEGGLLTPEGWEGETYPLLNFLNGGRITALELIIQCLPTRTLAKSPLIMASDWTIFFPLSTIFCEPQSTDWRLTRFPEACQKNKTWSATYIFTCFRIFYVFTSTFFLFLSKKIAKIPFFRIKSLQFANVLSLTHKVKTHLQPNFCRLILEIFYEIYLCTQYVRAFRDLRVQIGNSIK